MGFLHAAQSVVNRLLKAGNARIESLTSERAELARLHKLEAAGHFDKPVFPTLPQFQACDPSAIFEQIARDQSRFAELVHPAKADGFPLDNDYCTTPDAEVLYSIVHLYRPARIIEIGSGYSTQLFHLATRDEGLDTNLTSVDPDPRQDINRYTDQVVRERVEKLNNLELYRTLGANDILFIDSSHEVKAGNDLLYIAFHILPVLAPGVLIHFHDIFLPYEYPRDWIIEQRWNWTEQYLVQALLTGNASFEVLWPGYYLQRTHPNFQAHFKHWDNSTARALWLRKTMNG